MGEEQILMDGFITSITHIARWLEALIKNHRAMSVGLGAMSVGSSHALTLEYQPVQRT